MESPTASTSTSCRRITREAAKQKEFKRPGTPPSNSKKVTSQKVAEPPAPVAFPVGNGNSSTNSNNMEISNRPIARRGRGRGGITFLSGDPMKIGLIGKKGSLSTVVRALQQKKLLKKQNMGTLEKSRVDWQAFKKEEGIEEELRTQTKSKNGYLERQEFLQRTDLREFEIEKELRAKRRRLANSES